jgi:cytochrome c5
MTRSRFFNIAVATIAGCGAGTVVALAQSLPDGEGRDLVRSVCQDCHDLSPITSASFSRAEWDMVVKSMADMGANLKREDIPIIVNYLAASFPPRGKQ